MIVRYLGCDETEYGYSGKKIFSDKKKTLLSKLSSLILFPLIDVPYPLMLV